MTATATRKPRTKPERTATVSRTVPDNTLVLWLTVGNDVRAYGIRPLAAQYGQAAFRLLKANNGDGSHDEYDVLLNGARSTCECQGFLRHGMCKDGKGCKHIAGLQAALDAGKLPVVTERDSAEDCELDDL